MKRILLITESLGSGGAERQLCGLAAMLAGKDYVCRLATYMLNQFYQPYVESHGVDYELVPRLADKLLRIPNLVRYIKQYQPDVVISFLPHVNRAVCLAKLFCNFRLIVSERNNVVPFSFRDRSYFQLMRLADAIVANSYCREDFIRSRSPFLASKLRTIVNFVDTDTFSPAEELPNNKCPEILTVARYVPQKNCLLYLDAVKRLKDDGVRVHFIWHGNMRSEPGYVERVKKRVSELGIGDYISLRDEESGIAAIYRSADIFCLPSLYEGYPNTVVEAMACALPVLCGNICDNPKVVKDGVNGFLFNPTDSNDIVSAIKTIYALPEEKRHQMGLRNRDEAIKNNAAGKFLDNFISIIESDSI